MPCMGKKSGFASEVTIINFSGKRSTGVHIRKLFENTGRKPLLVDAGLETVPYHRGGKIVGQRVTKFTSGSVDYNPSEFVAHVHDLEKARLGELPVRYPRSSISDLSQQGPDALGGAGPGPPRPSTSTTNRGHWQELIPEGPPGLLEILTTFGEPRVSD